MTDRTVRVRLEAVTSQFQAGMAKASASAKATGTQIGEVSKKNQKGLDALGAGAVVAGAAMLYGFGKAVSAAADFDKAMSGVGAAAQGTAKEMGLLREAALQAGADTAFSATQAADGQEQLIKAGVSVKDVLGGGLTGALDLAAAGELEVGEAAEIAASAMTQFKLAGSDVPHIADLLAAGAGKAQGSVQDLGMALNQAGLVANATGLTIEETTGGLASFASAGLVGSDAGTSFKSMLQRLTPQSKEAAERMDELGISAYDSEGNFKGLAKFAGNLQGALKDLTPEQRNAAMATIFGSDAVRAANVLYEQGASGIKMWTRLVDDQGFAANVAAMRLDNLRGDQEALSGSLETALIKSGSSANAVLREMVQAATSVVNVYNDLPAPVQAAATAVLGVGGAVAVLGGATLIAIPRIAATKAAIAELGITAESTAAKFATLAKSAGLLAGAWILVDQAMDLKGDIADDGFWGGLKRHILENADTLDRWTGNMGGFNEAGKGAREELDKMGGSLDDVAESGFSAFESIQGLADQAVVMALSYEKPKTAVDALNESLEKQMELQNALAGGFIGLVSTLDGVASAEDELAKAQAKVNRLQEAGKEGTPAYRKALAALRDTQFGAIEAHISATEAINNYAKELTESGKPQSFVNAQIREYGRRAGLTKAQVNDLIKEVNDYRAELGKVPDKKHTRVTADTSPAENKIRDYLARLGSSTVNISVNASIRGAASSGFHTGGMVPGQGEVPARLLGGEFVVRKEQAQKYGAMLEALNAGVPYHNGGWVGRPEVMLDLSKLGAAIKEASKSPSFGGGNLVAVGRWLQSLGFRVSEHPAFGGVGPGHSPTGWHPKGRAIDFNYGPPGASAIERAAIAKVIPTLNRLPHVEFLHPFNDPYHDDHGHYAMHSGGIPQRDGSAFLQRSEIVAPQPVLRQVVREESGHSQPLIGELHVVAPFMESLNEKRKFAKLVGKAVEDKVTLIEMGRRG